MGNENSQYENVRKQVNLIPVMEEEDIKKIFSKEFGIEHSTRMSIVKKGENEFYSVKKKKKL